MIALAIIQAMFTLLVASVFFLVGRRCGSEEANSRAYGRGFHEAQTQTSQLVRETAQIILKSWGSQVQAELQRDGGEKVKLSAVVDLDDARRDKAV